MHVRTCEFGLPSVGHWNNSSPVLSNMLKDTLREIKVMLWGVTPTSSVVRESVIRRAEVSSSDDNRSSKTPFVVIDTPNFKTSSATKAIVENCGAQGSSVGTITLAVQITIPTRAT